MYIKIYKLIVLLFKTSANEIRWVNKVNVSGSTHLVLSGQNFCGNRQRVRMIEIFAQKL